MDAHNIKIEEVFLYPEFDNQELELQRLKEQMAILATQQGQKNELIKSLKLEMAKLENSQNLDQIKYGIGKLVRLIDFAHSIENTWGQLSIYFDSVGQDFLQRLAELHPQLSPKDHKVCAYIRLNLSNKEIAPLLGISVRGVEMSRYRLRKKLEIDTRENLVEYLGKL